jgi:hypothetical protein
MLQFNDHSGVANYVSPMRPHRNFDERFFHQALPRQVPWADVLRPRIAIVTRFVRPVMRLNLTAFGEHRSIARWADSTTAGKRKASMAVNECMQQQLTAPYFVIANGIVNADVVAP